MLLLVAGPRNVGDGQWQGEHSSCLKGIGVLVCHSFKWPDTLVLIQLSCRLIQISRISCGSKFEVIQADKNNLDVLICECARLRTTHDIAGATDPEEEFYTTVCKLSP